MKLLSLFEEEDEIGIKDPKARQALKLARTKYGWANNDLEAFVAMMQAEQGEQDSGIDQQAAVNVDQETEIGDNDTDITNLAQRITDLEQGREGQQDQQSPQGTNPGAIGEATSDNISDIMRIAEGEMDHQVGIYTGGDSRGVGVVADTSSLGNKNKIFCGYAKPFRVRGSNPNQQKTAIREWRMSAEAVIDELQLNEYYFELDTIGPNGFTLEEAEQALD